jgi:hypothetical protein
VAKKQTRRSVTLKEDSYQKVTTFCEAYRISRSAFLEEVIGAFFEEREPTFAPPANKADAADTPKPVSRGTAGRPKGAPVPKAKPNPPRGGGVHSL